MEASILNKVGDLGGGLGIGVSLHEVKRPFWCKGAR